MGKERNSEDHSLRSNLQASLRVDLFQGKSVNYEPAALRSPYLVPLQAPGPLHCTSSSWKAGKNRFVMYSFPD